MTKYSLNDFLDLKSATCASFSPDDDRIAFLYNESGTQQIHISDLDGENCRQLTDFEDRILFASFIPMKNQILFSKDSGGDEKMQLYIYDCDTDKITGLTSAPDSMFIFGSMSTDGTKISYVSNQRNGKDFDVYVLFLESGETKCLLKDAGWCNALTFSIAGDKIAVLERISNLYDHLKVIDIQSGAIEQISDPDVIASHGAHRWLKDGSGFYFTSNEHSDLRCVDFYDIQQKTCTRVLSYDYDVESITLSKDERFLTVNLNMDGYTQLKLIDADTMEEAFPLNLPDGLNGGVRWSNDSKMFAFNHEDARQQNSIWVWNVKENQAIRMSPVQDGISEHEMIKPELIHYPSFDDLSIPSFLFLPDQKSSNPVPLIVLIHGGPEGQYRPGFDAVCQYFIHNGYAVAAPNVRGSYGYGRHYLSLDDKEKRLDSVKDIVSLYHYVEKRDDIDHTRIALFGGSYGGYMVNANLAFYPDYWAAGISIVGIVNLVTFLENTSIWRRAVREAEYGSLETDREILERLSPIHKIDQITAPLLIIHGANDPRVPLSEAEQLHQAITERGKESELLVFSDEGHGLAKLKNRIEAYTKVVMFLDDHLK